MFAKRFFFVCAGLMCLALAYHFGATNATGAPQGNAAVAMCPEGTGHILALTANGDTYRAAGATRTYSWELVGNIFGAPTPVQKSTLDR